MARKQQPDGTEIDTPDETAPAAEPAPPAPARPRGVRVVVICDLEPWIGDAPRKAGDLVEDVEPELADLMQRRGHVRIIPN